MCSRFGRAPPLGGGWVWSASFAVGSGFSVKWSTSTASTSIHHAIRTCSWSRSIPSTEWGTGRLRPFVTGGYTALFGSHQFFNVNVGAGVNYRFQERIAVRVEFRNHTLSFSTPLNSYGLRLGVGFGI